MTETVTLCNGIWLRLKRRGRWEYAERTNPGGGVMIIAVTPEDNLLFVEQYRPALECMTIEMPAGLVGDIPESSAESAIEAAHRELIEETGYAAGHIDFIMEGPTSAGMSNEILAFVHARDLRRVNQGGGDATDCAQAAQWLVRKMAEGFSVDPKMFAGLYFLEHDRMMRGV